MELKDLVKNLRKHFGVIAALCAFGMLCGVGFYYLPNKYIATGSFYVDRTVDKSFNFFTYEGFYSQQTAQSYTNTVAGLLNSTDIQSKALTTLQTPINAQTLHKYAKNVSVKKTAPQLITLTVKGNTQSDAALTWKATSQALLEYTRTLNTKGDDKLTVSQVSEQPLIKEQYESLPINISLGLVLGAMLGFGLIALKEYA